MKPKGPFEETPPPHGEHFATTRWNVVLAAADSTAPESRTALEQLCRTYWPPLFSFLRRNGYPAEQAGDLTQGFFEFVLEHHTLHFADPLAHTVATPAEIDDEIRHLIEVVGWS